MYAQLQCWNRSQFGLAPAPRRAQTWQVFRASLGLLAVLSVWSAACAVYDPSLFDEGAGSDVNGGVGGSLAGHPAQAGDSAGGTVTGGTSAGTSASGGTSSVSASGGTTGPAGSGGTVFGGGGGSSGGTSPVSSGGTSPVSSGGAGSINNGGGSSGAGGTGVLELVDDFETPDTYGGLSGGRVPVWYLFNDMTVGTQLPALLEMTPMPAEDEAVRPGSSYALFTSSTGFSSWGSGVGVDLNNDTAKQIYDASDYVGISFYAKVPGSYRVVRVNVPDVGTDASGGVCDADAGECSDHFGELISLTADWQRHDVYFSDLKQVGWGLTRDALSLSEVYSVQFQIAAGKDVELWIDDLNLIKK